jgi:hypothetical protein
MALLAKTHWWCRLITSKAFWKGRDVEFKSQLTPTIQVAAADTIRRANKLLEMFYAANPNAVRRDANSGWRPAAVNKKTSGASPTSWHMFGKAVDIDDDDEDLDEWLMTEAGQKALVECELWMEHPRDTPRWTHVQTVAPRSGRRVFYAK